MQSVYTDPTGIPHVMVRGKRVAPFHGSPRVGISRSTRSASYGPDVRTVYPVAIAPGATPVISGLGDLPSWGDISDDDGTLALKAPVTTIGGAVVGGLIFSSIAKRGWLGMLLGGLFGYAATALGRENRRLKEAAGPAGTPPASDPK